MICVYSFVFFRVWGGTGMPMADFTHIPQDDFTGYGTIIELPIANDAIL